MQRYIHGLTTHQFELFEFIMDWGCSDIPYNTGIMSALIEMGLIQIDASGELLVLTHKGMKHAQSVREAFIGPPDRKKYQAKTVVS